MNVNETVREEKMKTRRRRGKEHARKFRNVRENLGKSNGGGHQHGSILITLRWNESCGPLCAWEKEQLQQEWKFRDNLWKPLPQRNSTKNSYFINSVILALEL